MKHLRLNPPSHSAEAEKLILARAARGGGACTAERDLVTEDQFDPEET